MSCAKFVVFVLALHSTIWNGVSSTGNSIHLRLPDYFYGTVRSAEVRVDYSPPEGSPRPNFTVGINEALSGFQVDNVSPGRDYEFRVYSPDGALVWTERTETEPDVASNLSVSADSGKIAYIHYEPPPRGGYTAFKLSITPECSQDDAGVRTMNLSPDADTSVPVILRDLTPGCSYEAELYTLYKSKESSQFLSYNFTMKPNAPGRFIVWFRNETTLLVLWQPPYPSGVFNQYRVSISPPDAPQSVLFVEKETEPPGPAQAAFYGLVPGRAYNISVQTVSRHTVSLPTDAQYRTVPLPPTNVTFPPEKLSSRSFEVRWSEPKSHSEFDRYQVALSLRHSLRQIVPKEDERRARFEEDMKPGHTYEVMVKTVSGNVASWPVTGNVTTHPFPVRYVNATAKESGQILLEWAPNDTSLQDSYTVKYNELESFNSDAIKVTRNTSVLLTDLLQGRNYSLSVIAISKGVPSDPVTVYQATRPASPVIEALEPINGPGGYLNISWKSDVTSRQDSFVVVHTRNDTKEKKQETTKLNWLVLKNLFPGASYQIKVSAISHGLWSEPHSYFHTVGDDNISLVPRSPSNLQVVKTTNSSMSLSWISPVNSIVDHYLVQYKIGSALVWKDSVGVNGTSYDLVNLTAGERYTVRVVAASNKAESVDSPQVEQTIYPNPIANVRHSVDSQNVTFHWIRPPGRIDYYVVVYNPVSNPLNPLDHQVLANQTFPDQNVTTTIAALKPGVLYSFRLYTVPAQEKLQNDTNRLVLFDNLTPGRLYNISIWTVSAGVYSIPIYRHTRLYPDPVKDIRALTVTDTDISLIWEHSGASDGDRDGYEVQYLDPRGNLVQNLTLSEHISYTNLKPHHNFTFVVTVISGYETSTVRRSLPMSQTFQTLESVPGRVHYFRPLDLRPSEVTLEWSLPSGDRNGVLTGYKITYYLKGASERRYRNFEPNTSKGTISNLVPGRTYVFEIQAHTKIGPGGKAHWEETMPIWPPPKPSETVYPTTTGHTATTMKVVFRKNYFTNAHGPVQAYAIIVAEDDTQPTDHLEPMPSWFDVQSFRYWPPYQVSEAYYPFNGSVTSEEFLIGGEDCSKVKAAPKTYCNGPLKAGSAYRVKVRAYTEPGKYTDTVWSYAIQTDPDNTPLIAGIVVPLSLLSLLALLLLILRRKRMGPFSSKPPLQSSPLHHHKNTNPASAIDSTDSMAIHETNEPLIITRPIKIIHFVDHYRLMSADSDFRFSEEFELLKHVGRDRPCAAADLPVNRPKNRFTNILPYDHSRVKLLPTDDEDGSDYINANYISGYNSPREFIVTQGPLHSTRDDFWRMVWEQNCRAIVMLTRCVEKGREKCDHYWPFDTQPCFYGDIQVTMLNESQYPDWTISEFKVSRGDQSRIVRHFHFTTWPDFGVPDPPQTLVRFVRAFRERVIPDNKPITVHCSAGVGRSGTFIALDRILQSIRKYDTVDIFGIVYEMRKDRVWMVQNEQQYICIHQCLLCVLEGNEDTVSKISHENQGFEGGASVIGSCQPSPNPGHLDIPHCCDADWDAANARAAATVNGDGKQEENSCADLIIDGATAVDGMTSLADDVTAVLSLASEDIIIRNGAGVESESISWECSTVAADDVVMNINDVTCDVSTEFDDVMTTTNNDVFISSPAASAASNNEEDNNIATVEKNAENVKIVMDFEGDVVLLKSDLEDEKEEEKKKINEMENGRQEDEDGDDLTRSPDSTSADPG